MKTNPIPLNKTIVNKIRMTHCTDVHHKCNLYLQILLFFNSYLAVIWTLLYGHYILYYVSYLGQIQKVLTIAGFVIAVPAEGLRLYLGYSGNLRGKVSDLAGFWIITTLIQFPIHVYFSYTTEGYLILRLVEYLITIFLLLEIPVGGYASRQLSIYQAQLYHIKMLFLKAEKEKRY